MLQDIARKLLILAGLAIYCKLLANIGSKSRAIMLSNLCILENS